jgi:DNA-binding transcriptional ArsR family regulator
MTDGETLTPAEAFAAVSNETRLAILQALAEGHRDMSFSELRAAVGMADSAQFNYHLKQLQPQFVLKTEEGYRIRYAGKQVVRAIVVGTFTTDLTRGPFDVPGECVSCGAALQATYEDEMLTVECGTCGRLHSKMAFPSSGLRERSDEELLSAYDRWVRAEYDLVHGGVCSNCGGPMEATLVGTMDVYGYACGDEEADRFEVGVNHHCEQCDAHVGAAVGMGLLYEREVVTFYADHGADLEEVRYWELPWTVSDRYTTVEDEEPWRLAVTIPLEDEILCVTLDGSLAVETVERVSADSGATAEA